MPSDLTSALGRRVGLEPPHLRDDPAAHLALPAPQRPRDDHHPRVPAPDGPHLRPLGQRQPVRACCPTTRSTSWSGGHRRRPTASRPTLGAPPRRPARHRVGDARQRQRHCVAARLRHQCRHRLDADLQPDQAADAERVPHDRRRRRPALRPHHDDDHVGQPGPHGDPAADRRQHRARCHDHGARSASRRSAARSS